MNPLPLFTRFSRRWLSLVALSCAWLVLISSAAPSTLLTLHRERSSPTDLAVTGRLKGLASGETRYLRWAELSALPKSQLTLTGEFVPGEQTVTVVFLADLWSALPRSEGADALLATCTDGYAGIYRTDFIQQYRPFLVLAINGDGPEKWPPPGLKFNPGPYVISVAAAAAPAVAHLLDAGHKRPWGVNAIEIANFQERFAPFYRDDPAATPPAVALGRELWINSCASCHHGPAGTFGGNKTPRPFEVLAAHATKNTAYFKTYVRDPQGFVATAKMEAHPHYTEAQLDALVAFLAAQSRKK